MTIRPAEPRDVAAIASFNVAMCRETEGRELDAATVRAGVAAAIGGRARYFVAEDGGEDGSGVVGCVMVTTEWSDWRDGDLWWLQSVYVRPEARGRGVFRRMYEHVVAEATAAGAVGLRLYVERDNAAARATYRRLGMVETPYRMMEMSLQPRANGP